MSRIASSSSTRPPAGFHPSSRRNDSTTGLLTREIGASQGTDTGVTPSPSGSLMMVRKSFALVRLKSLRHSQAVARSLISIESTSTIFRSHLRREEACLRESQRSLTAGSKVARCHSLKVTTHSPPTKRSLTRSSQLISLLRVSTKLVAGSTL